MVRKFRKRPTREPIAEIPECLQAKLMSQNLAKEEFTEITADIFRQALPEAEVRVAGPLDITLGNPEEKCRAKASLVNTWEMCRDFPSRRPSLVAQHVRNLVEMFRQFSVPVPEPSRDTIVPMIKNDSFIRANNRQIGAIDTLVAERLAADIWVAYVINLKTTIAYLSETQRKALGLSMEELREIAITNLRRLMPKVWRSGVAPCFIIAQDGTWDASVLLLDEVWEEQAKVVDGDLVVTVPVRCVVLFTGSKNLDAIPLLRKLAHDGMEAGPYPISDSLLIRRNGKWEPYDQTVFSQPLN